MLVFLHRIQKYLKMSVDCIRCMFFAMLFLFLSNIYFFYIFYKANWPHFSNFRSSYSFYNKTDESFLVYTPGCKIPKINPFDATVREFYTKNSSVYDCGPNKPLFYVRNHGTVSIDEAELYKQHKVFLNEIDCSFYPISRKYYDYKPDGSFILGKEYPMIFDLPIEEDFILLKCRNETETFAEDILALTPRKPKGEKNDDTVLEHNKNLLNKLNVIIVGIDSVSKLNFLRYFRKTLNLLRNDLSAIELHGYTKVADNTYPNLIAFLTGHSRNYYKALEERYGFYDNVDFVWKRYSDLGYTTLYSEDAPHMGTFISDRRGFKHPPTDYYPLPLAMAVEAFNMRRKTHCFGSVMEMEVYFNYLRNFISTMDDRPIFTLTYMVRMTHDILENARYADRPSYKLIKDLKQSGIFNRSLFILFSDHGMRFGKIRETYIGKIEDRMPFIFLVFPEWFMKKYPHFLHNLKINENRLTTPYDVHATLLHLLQLTNESYFTIYGQSLLTEISPERTCTDAGIAKHWCVCQSRELISTKDASVRKAAIAVVRYLNTLLRPFNKVCETLKLAKVLDARVTASNAEFLEESAKDYLITFLVIPSNGVFEATVQMKGNKLIISDDVSRLNKYNNESICVTYHAVKKYCYCKMHSHHS